MNSEGITPIGITNYRNTNKKFGIKDNDRLQHIYTIGKSGTGKSTLLKNMALSDIHRGNGICILDPHGDIAESIVKQIPEWRKKDLVYFNPRDTTKPIAFNPLKGIHPNYHHLVTSGLISAFKKIWHESWGPRMEHVLRFSILTLLHYPDATLLDIQPILTDPVFRVKVLNYVTDLHLYEFWEQEFCKYSPSFRAEVISPILNKLGLFRASAPLRNTVGQKTRGIRIQDIMDNQKILVCNLSKGELGEDASSLLGCILLTTIQMAALYRARIEEYKRIPFYVYIDECQSFLTKTVSDLLAEVRKYKLSLFLAHQFIEQLDEETRSAIFGNVGTLIAFRVGARDAEYVAKEFYPVFSQEDLINLPRYAMYIKMLIDGTTSAPFSAISLPVGKG